MTLSAASAAEERSSSAKLEMLLAKLAVRKLELDKAAAEARVAASESDASDDEQILFSGDEANAKPRGGRTTSTNDDEEEEDDEDDEDEGRDNNPGVTYLRSFKSAAKLS